MVIDEEDLMLTRMCYIIEYIYIYTMYTQWVYPS